MGGINQILITLDSCRWDTFEQARAPFLKSGRWERCWTHGTFTMAAHQAFFAGKLPHNYTGRKYFDTAAAGGRRRRAREQIWRLDNPESNRPSHVLLNGRNIRDGFRRQGYTTIGTGAMNWFDPAKPATEHLLSDFDHYRFFSNREMGDGRNLELQVEWALETIARTNRPYFLFINVGETHHRYQAKGHPYSGEWGKRRQCAQAQGASLEYVDGVLSKMLGDLNNYLAVVCGDHGDCWGEDGLWGHGFYHPKVMEVPMVVLSDRSPYLALRRLWADRTTETRSSARAKRGASLL